MFSSVNNSLQSPKSKSNKETNPYEKIQQIPEVNLTLEDMNSDPTELIAMLQEKHQKYGAIKLKVCP